MHHNLVHNVDRQGIYVDAWFGEISDIEIFSNVIQDCRMAGVMLSVENGKSVENVSIHNNLIFNNDGSGLYFSRWGVDNSRRNIQISNNTFYHNGYGRPSAGQTYYWLTGGLYLYSTNISEVSIRNNIFSDNRGFQIGYSDLFLKDYRSWETVAREKKIQITGNLIDGRNTIGSPIESGGDSPDRVDIYAVNGEPSDLRQSIVQRSRQSKLYPASRFSRGDWPRCCGSLRIGSPSKLWWKRDFPPRLVRTRFDRSGQVDP